ncbi:lipopolysaccharide biosynthesis protein [Luteimonas sp. A649]
MKAIRAKLGARHGFVHSVGTLVGGTAFAQALALLALPILTRLYTPAEFSVLAVYASLLAILTVVACLRLEIAIPIPARDEAAASLLVVALCSSFGFALIVVLALACFPGWIAGRLGVPAFAPYLWMVPLGVWIASSYAAVQYWSTRKKKFTRIARTRMVQALGGVGTQAGAGWLGAGPFGLLLGHMISGGAGLFGLARDAWREDRTALRSVTRASMTTALREYSRFPKYSALEALANTAGSQLPVIIIAALAIGPEAGYLMLATRVMAAPMALIGASVAQVYLSRAPEELRQGSLPAFTARIFGGLVKTGVGPLLFAGIVASPVFALVFGEEWRRAGDLLAWMTPWSVLQFLSSPVSMVMHVRMQQARMLLLAIFGLVLRVGVILLVVKFTPDHIVESYAVSAAAYYLVLSVVFYKLSGCGVRSLLQQARKTLVTLVGWVGFGVLVRLGMEWVDYAK